MIAYLKGNFVNASPTQLYVEVAGVAYEVNISLNTFAEIQGKDSGLLYTHLIVREDAHILYGFASPAEKEMFQMLIAVSGIGANTARVLLSYMSPKDLSQAIMLGNVKALESVKGIGKKTAERLVVELKDKMAKKPVESNISALKDNTLQTDALNALLALGIARPAGEKAVEKAIANAPNSSVEDIIKQALKNL